MDNVTINNCDHVKTILSNNGFMIAIYRAEKAVELPDGTTSRQISVKGYNLPAVEGIKYDITGKFEKYAKNNTWSLAVITIDEVQPSTSDSVLAYLKTLSGVGKKRAQDLFDAFGLDVFNVIENNPERLLEIRGFKGKSVEKMLLDYAKRKTGRKLFQFLYKYRINEAKIMRLHTILGPDSLEIIKENPFVICEILHINFRTVDTIRIDLGLPTTFKPRLKAGIYEVLQQAEFGGELFDARNEFPSFIFDSFLPEPIYSLAFNKQELYKTSGTYIPEYVCYLMFLKLLCLPISFNDFRVLADELRKENQIYIRYENGEVRYYRWKTAMAEYRAAKKVAELMCCKFCENDIDDTFESAKEIIYESQDSGVSASNSHMEDIDRVLSVVEKKLQMKLSPEQENAVKMALSNKVSIITGGPGTGKTSVEKSIISCYRILHPDEGILLIAPTGRAAKRMSESTGAPASTIHKALGLIQNDDGELVETGPDSILVETLIIVDEASMIGTFLLNTLLQHVSNRARIVFIGDVDQLPSIEIGAVLREMISSSVPVMRLTQTFRQANGSNIIVNAARINIGEKRLVYDDDFQLVEKDSSKEIQDAVVSEYLNLLKRYSDDEIVVLSPFRKSTETGTNSLNIRLRSVMRPDITPSTPYFERKNTRFYQGDKVMFTRNTEKLTNGDIGTITSIFKGKDGLYVTCNFENDIDDIELQEEELLNLELAYAMTVHKSQGSEYKAVIMVVDNKHKVLLKRNLLYTAITRAKEKLILIGQQDAINVAIDNLDSIYRRTKLGALINGYCAEFSKEKEPTKKKEDQEQLAISF